LSQAPDFLMQGTFPIHSRVAASVPAAGVLGNLTDRLIHGQVIDFLDVILPWYGHWPSFNIADWAISAADVLFLWASFTAPAKS
jgi:signal peptidase II